MPPTNLAARKAKSRQKAYEMANFSGLHPYVQPGGLKKDQNRESRQQTAQTFAVQAVKKLEQMCRTGAAAWTLKTSRRLLRRSSRADIHP